MQNIPMGEEFRHVQARLAPVREIRVHVPNKELEDYSRSKLDQIEQKDKVPLWGKEVTGRQAIWELAQSRIALMDDIKQDAAREFIRKDINNAKEFIIVTNPLVDAYHHFTTQKANYRQHQEQYRDNPPVNITIGAKVGYPLEEGILKALDYKSPISDDIVPTATLLSLNVVDMGKLLDTARDEHGNIDQQALRDSLSQGTEYFNPNQQYNITVYHNETGIARRKIRDTLESQAMMKVERSAVYLLNNLPVATSVSKDIDLPRVIELTKAVGEIARDAKVLGVMKECGLLLKGPEERYVLEAVKRITENLNKTTERVRPRRTDVETVVFFTGQLRKLIEAKTELVKKLDRAVHEYIEFEDKFSKPQPSTFIAGILTRRIVAEKQRTDAIIVQDPELRALWSYTVGAMRDLVQHHYEVEQDVDQLLGVQEV